MTKSEIALMKKRIEIQLDEYAAEIAAYDKFMAEWRARQPKGFRAKRRRNPPREAPAETVGEGAE